MTSDPLDRNLEFLINDVARLLRREFGRRVRDMDLTRSQWWVMVHLIRFDGYNQTQLAEELEIGKVALGGLLDRLEARGWIERRGDPEDRRVMNVLLTEAGARIRSSRTLLDPSRVDGVLRQLPARDRADALRGLILLADASDAFLVRSGREPAG